MGGGRGKGGFQGEAVEVGGAGARHGVWLEEDDGGEG